MRRVTLAGALLLCAWSPFLREHPAVKDGNERLLSGDAPAALERYAAAEGEVGPKPELEYDRGSALLAQGRNAEAAAAFRRAVERGADPRLASRALQNTGNALAATGDRAGAISAFADALARDPSNDDARYDLEVMLRREAQPERSQGGPKKDQSGGGDGGAQASAAPSPGRQDPADGGEPRGDDPAARAQRPEPRPEGDPRDGAPRRDGERDRRAEPRPEGAGDERDDPRDGEADGRDALSRHEAEALLDALRARERNMPMAPPRERRTRRTDAERDW
ncbi:MAG TPA: tetratricopeptide repeat protein [Anaeromyxobacteraceae bacterium]|nr:tetratricopeptide repeat protein [Anaeromyxobacteraceae bacterium]